MKLAHLSDLHWSNERLDQKVLAAEQMLAELQNRRPGVIVVAGDTFDHSIRMEEAAARKAAEFFRNMQEIAPVLAIKGNYSHDRDSVEMLELLGRITVSVEPEVVALGNIVGAARTYDLGRMSLQAALTGGTIGPGSTIPAEAVFFTLPYPSQSYLAEVARLSPEEMRVAVSNAITGIIRGFAAVPVHPGVPRILVFHGTVKEAQASETQHAMGMDIELTLGDIDACGFDLVCAGHLHFAQMLRTLTGIPVCYPGGSIYGCFGDGGRKGFWEHRLRIRSSESESRRPVVVESEHVETRTRQMVIVNLDLNADFVETPPEAAGADVQVRVSMTEAQREQLAGMKWAEIFPGSNVDVRPDIAKVESIRCEEVRTAHTLREKVTAWGKHQETIGDPVPGLTDSVLGKADMLEALDVAALIESTKKRLHGEGNATVAV